MQDHRRTHLAIKERQIASKYLAIHDRQIAIAHLTMKVPIITINFFSERERQVTTATCYVCLTKQIIQKENILFMFYHIHGTFKITEYSVSYLRMYLILIPTMTVFIVLRSYLCRIIDIRT